MRAAPFLIAGVIGALCAAAPAFATDTAWSVDAAHSSATFSTDHVLVTRVTGTIPITTATIAIPPGNAIPSSVTATLDPSRIDTNNSARDASLRSANFLDVASYPTIAFTSTHVAAVDASHFTMTGNLTIHGVTRPVTLACAYVSQSGAGSALRLDYEAHTTIDRTQWGMLYGAPIVGTSIDIELSIEATQQ